MAAPADGVVVEYLGQALADDDTLWAPSVFGVPYSTENEAATVAFLHQVAAWLPGGTVTHLARVWEDENGGNFDVLI